MNQSSEIAISLVQKLADHHGVRVDRSQISRWLPSTPMETQEDLLAWLVSSGHRAGIRVGYADCEFADILAFARHGIPLALRFVDGAGTSALEHGEGLSAEGGRWLLIRGYGFWRRFKVEEIGQGTEARSVSRSELKRLTGLKSNRRVRCLIAQPIVADGVDKGTSGDDAKQPLRRLVRLMRPDMGDVWAMIVFSLVVGTLTLAAPLAVEALVNTVAFGRYVQPVLVLALMLFVFLGFAASLRLLLTIIAELIQRRLFVRLSEDLGYRLPRVATSALDGKYGPELVNRFLDIANIQKTLASLLLDGISLVVSALVGMAVLGFYHTWLLGFDIVLLLLMAITIFVLGRGAVQSAKQESKAKYKLTAWLEELIRCPTAFSLHGGQRFALDRTDKLAVSYLDYRRTHFGVLLRQISFALLIYATALTVLLGLGGWLVIIGELNLGQLVAAELIVGVVVGAFAKMGKHMESYYDMLASVDKVGVLLDLPTESIGGPLQFDGVEPARVEINDLSVAAGGSTILQGVTTTLEPAAFTALCGPPGSGKSLLVDALAARRTLTRGEIVIDGSAINQLDSETLRHQIGLAREVEIFEGTLAENVHLFRKQIRLPDVREALERVGLTREVRKLPDGLEVKLSSTGAPLSRDQALRLMIARAIVGRPRLLMLDGVLDGLNDASLEFVIKELTSRPQPWTLLVATGREAIASRADYQLFLGTERTARASGGSSDSET